MDSVNPSDLHSVITKTYQNIFDIAPVLKELSTAARSYHKALQNVSSASLVFHQTLSKISRMASASKGPAQPLGETIQDIMDTHKDIENRRQEITKLMMNDLIVPIESLVESDNVYVKAILKNYNHDNKTKVESVEKAKAELLKVRKKSQRKKPTEKYEEKEKQCDDYYNNLQRQLENFRKESCQRSLSEEWKRYVFVVDRSSIFMKSYMDFYDHNAAMLRERLSVWFAQVKKKPGYQEQEANGSVNREVIPLGSAMTSKVKIMAIFDHNATEDSQLSFKQGDIIDPISEVVSGWQYGQNVKTSKSGWFPAAYTQEIVAVPTGSSVSQTMPASGAHVRPQLDQSSGHKSLKRYSSAGPSTMAIPTPDYGPSAQETLNSAAPPSPPITPAKDEEKITEKVDSKSTRPSSVTLPPPPPPPPITPPPESENNNDGERSNPFTGVTLKKTVTNDRSAPKIA